MKKVLRKLTEEQKNEALSPERARARKQLDHMLKTGQSASELMQTDHLDENTVYWNGVTALLEECLERFTEEYTEPIAELLAQPRYIELDALTSPKKLADAYFESIFCESLDSALEDANNPVHHQAISYISQLLETTFATRYNPDYTLDFFVRCIHGYSAEEMLHDNTADRLYLYNSQAESSGFSADYIVELIDDLVTEATYNDDEEE